MQGVLSVHVTEHSIQPNGLSLTGLMRAFVLLIMGCHLCQKYFQMAYLYISFVYINTTVIYLNFCLIYIHRADIVYLT